MDFLSSVSNLDNQSYILIAFSVLLAFLLSTLIVFTYEKASRDVVPPDHFIQSLILMAIVTTTIMQSIGDSLARGFGIFGALAILRFRINISSPRNISFVFASMAVGIACGVYSFINAVIGTLAFCLIALFLRLTPFSRTNNLLGQLRFELPAGSSALEEVEKLMRQLSRRFVLKRYRLLPPEAQGDWVEYSFELRLRDESQGAHFAQQLRSVAGIRNLRLSFNDTYINQYD